MRIEDFVERWPDAPPMLTFALAGGAGLRPDSRVIGADGNGSPIVLRSDGVVVVLDHDHGLEEIVLGSSLDRLHDALTAYQQHISSIQDDHGDEAWLDGNFDQSRLVELQSALRAADAAAWESFWSDVVDNEREAVETHQAEVAHRDAAERAHMAIPK